MPATDYLLQTVPLPKLQAKLEMLLTGPGIGTTVEDILSFGTYGHHWKEFSPAELKRYFEMLSPDFVDERLECVATQNGVRLGSALWNVHWLRLRRLTVTLFISK